MAWPVLALILASVTISAVAQVALKHGMSSSAVQEAVAAGGIRAANGVARNLFIWFGLALYGLGAVLWLGVLAKVDLGQAYPFVGLGFLLTMTFGIVFLGEGLNVTRLIGTGLVVAGVILVARSA